MKLKNEILARGFPVSQRCMWSMNHRRKDKEGLIVGFVQVPEYEYTFCHGQPPIKQNTHVLVLAQTFCKGQILQLPLECVEVVDEYLEGE